MEVLAFISFFLGASWDFFTEIKVPGFDFSFAALFVGMFLASLGLRFLGMMLNITVSSDNINTDIKDIRIGRKKYDAWRNRRNP